MRRVLVSLRTFLSRAPLSLLILAFCGPVLADPPDHAPAHGWRKKHDPSYVGYTGGEWPRDYGIVTGHCNRDEIGTVLGAVVGGAVGSQVGEGSNRTVAIVVGSVLGAVIGREIGKDLDERDRACVGHSLELVKDGQRVRWVNEQTHVTYLLTPRAPAKGAPSNCRTYDLKATVDGRSRTSTGRACRDGGGTWSIQP
jgi:surface antigen